MYTTQQLMNFTKKNMNSGIIIFSSDTLFVSCVCFHFREEHLDSVIERVLDIEELVILLEAFIKEEINSIQLICDHKLSINEMSEIEEIIDNYSDQIVFELRRGIEEYYEFQDI
jgi:hypothetical protein